MDAGVPISAPVSGVAMGMVFDDDTGKYVILSDIQAQEDFLGDMDFKVAGTRKGITALPDGYQKLTVSLSRSSVKYLNKQKAREFILQWMLKSIDKPRAEVSKIRSSAHLYEDQSWENRYGHR